MTRRGAVVAAMFVSSVIGAAGVARAQSAAPTLPPGVTQGQPPSTMSGRVVEVDQKSGRLVIQSSDGQRREFQMNPSQVANTKVGDEVEATRVSPPQ